MGCYLGSARHLVARNSLLGEFGLVVTNTFPFSSSTISTFGTTYNHCSLSLCVCLNGIESMPVDLLKPSASVEQSKHKLKRLIQSPNSSFWDVKCSGCFHITTIFSHAQTVVTCSSCAQILSQPKGGKCVLTEGCSYRPKKEGN